MDHIGIDLHKRESQICIETEFGEIIEKRIRTERERFEALLGNRPRAKILLEAMTESEWVARCLEDLGHEVVVADPNYAAIVQRHPVLRDTATPSFAHLSSGEQPFRLRLPVPPPFVGDAHLPARAQLPCWATARSRSRSR